MSSHTDYEHACKENPNIICERQSGCAVCGWNPEVDQKRREKIKRGGKTALAAPQPEKPKELMTEAEKRANYQRLRIRVLRTMGRCPVCGEKTDRPDRYCCSACYEREKT